MDGQIDIYKERYRQLNRQLDGWIDRQLDGYIEYIDIQIERQIDSH